METPTHTRMILISPEVRADAERVIQNALAQRIHLDDLKAVVAEVEAGRRTSPLSDRLKGCNMVIPVGYFVTFTVEQQPGGWARHISISIKSPTPASPHPMAVQLIAELFGFQTRFKYADGQLSVVEGTNPVAVYTEPMNNEGREAINLIEKAPDLDLHSQS